MAATGEQPRPPPGNPVTVYGEDLTAADNRPTPDYLVLHKASCGSFASAVGDGRSWTVAYMKVCSDAASTIESWCRRQVGAEPQRCGVCHP